MHMDSDSCRASLQSAQTSERVPKRRRIVLTDDDADSVRLLPSRSSDASEPATDRADGEDDEKPPDTVRTPIPPQYGSVLVHTRDRRWHARSATRSRHHEMPSYPEPGTQEALWDGEKWVDLRSPVDTCVNGSVQAVRSAGPARRAPPPVPAPLLTVLPRTMLTSQAARTAAAEHKWLLCNLQSSEEFLSYSLNRDLWNRADVKHFVREHFVFWQESDTTPWGVEYRNIASMHLRPHVAIWDPRTMLPKQHWGPDNLPSLDDRTCAPPPPPAVCTSAACVPLGARTAACLPSSDGSSLTAHGAPVRRFVDAHPFERSATRPWSVYDMSEAEQLRHAVEASLQIDSQAPPQPSHTSLACQREDHGLGMDSGTNHSADESGTEEASSATDHPTTLATDETTQADEPDAAQRPTQFTATAPKYPEEPPADAPASAVTTIHIRGHGVWHCGGAGTCATGDRSRRLRRARRHTRRAQVSTQRASGCTLRLCATRHGGHAECTVRVASLPRAAERAAGNDA